MSESSDEYDGCFPSNAYPTLVSSIFGGISLFGILWVIIGRSFAAYKKTQSRVLEKQMKYQIESKQTEYKKQRTLSNEKDNNNKPQNTSVLSPKTIMLIITVAIGKIVKIKNHQNKQNIDVIVIGEI